MSNVQSGITLTAIMDGATINGYVKVLNTPLIQRYTKGSKNFIPDFEALSDAKKPVVAAILRDAMSGEVKVPNTITFKYNGIPLTFGEDNLCNTLSFEGVFKRILNHPVPIGAETINMTVLQVVKNLVPLSGYDNDSISVSGTIEMEGQSMEFNEVSTPVVIQESTGNQYDVIIEDDNGGCVDKVKPTVTLTANLLRDSVIVNDLQGFSFTWNKMTANGDVPMSSQTNQQTVTKDDIDDTLLVRCDVRQGDALVASGYREIKDFSDTYYVEWNTTDQSGAAVGRVLRKGNVVKVTPVAVSREGGSTSKIAECTYRSIDNAGKDFILTGKDSATFPGKQPDISFNVSFDDMKRAGFGLHVRLDGRI